MRMMLTDLDFRFNQEFSAAPPDAYQRLLLDAMNGDASLFARSDEVELAWGIIDPILAAWNSPAAPPMESYPVGLWGPEASTLWMRKQGREWFDVCPVLH
jgi:glucose-6-phosphate 1-dehydrogenase